MDTHAAMIDIAQAGSDCVVAFASQTANMSWIKGGTYLKGSNDHYPEEAPVHRVSVDGFWIDRYAVTNAVFQRFVDATGYVTLAERPATRTTIRAQSPKCWFRRR